MLPGVTVTATSVELIRPVVVVSDNAGYYRLLNLPPGTYTVSAELAGFSTYKREGILMRVELDCGFPLAALLTRQACEELALQAGDRVTALVKAPHVHLIAH